LTWREVKQNRPCPICDKPDWCGRSDDGAARCMRIADPPAGWRTVKACPDGGTVFRPSDESSSASPTRQARTTAARRNAGGNGAKTYPTLGSAIAALAQSANGRHVHTWTYHHSDGREAFHVVRFDLDELDADTGKPKKQFRPIHEDGTGWRIGDPPGPPDGDLLPLYRLPHLSGQPRVFIVEGERCADEAAAIGFGDGAKWYWCMPGAWDDRRAQPEAEGRKGESLAPFDESCALRDDEPEPMASA